MRNPNPNPSPNPNPNQVPSMLEAQYTKLDPLGAIRPTSIKVSEERAR